MSYYKKRKRHKKATWAHSTKAASTSQQESPPQTPTLLALSPWTSCLWICEKRKARCWSHPACDILPWQPENIETPGECHGALGRNESLSAQHQHKVSLPGQGRGNILVITSICHVPVGCQTLYTCVFKMWVSTHHWVMKLVYWFKSSILKRKSIWKYQNIAITAGMSIVFCELFQIYTP